MIDLQLSVAGHHRCYSGILAGQRTLSSLACAHLEASLTETRRGEWRHSESNANGKTLALLPTEFAELPAHELCNSVEINAELEAQTIRLRAVHTRQRSYFSNPAASFWVDADGAQAELTHCSGNRELWLFGPVLILALARLGVYCLHASAFLEGDAASVTVGNSGAGKSSLARAVSKQAGAQRLCDDITPITLRAGKLYVLPRFPQLKLKAIDQGLPESVPLKRLILLNAAQLGSASSHQLLTQRGLFDALTKHTVATRLFSDADTGVWWQQLPQIMAAVADARCIRPAFDARAPESAMLAALGNLDNLWA